MHLVTAVESQKLRGVNRYFVRDLIFVNSQLEFIRDIDGLVVDYPRPEFRLGQFIVNSLTHEEAQRNQHGQMNQKAVECRNAMRARRCRIIMLRTFRRINRE